MNDQAVVPATNLVATDCLALYEAAQSIKGTATSLAKAAYATIVEILAANVDNVTTTFASLTALRAFTKSTMRDRWQDACTMHAADPDAGKVMLSDANAAIVALAMGADKTATGEVCTSVKALAKIGREILDRLNPAAPEAPEADEAEPEAEPATDWESILRKVHAELATIDEKATKASILARVNSITADIATALKA